MEAPSEEGELEAEPRASVVSAARGTSHLQDQAGAVFSFQGEG